MNSFTTDTTNSTLLLGFVSSVTAENKDRLCVKIPCSMTIPNDIDTYTVIATINGVSVPLLNKYGNSMTVAELKKNCVMKGYFGTTPTNHLLITNIPIVLNCRC